MRTLLLLVTVIMTAWAWANPFKRWVQVAMVAGLFVVAWLLVPRITKDDVAIAMTILYVIAQSLNEAD